MTSKFPLLLIFMFFFIQITHLKAQESKTILDLKSKLSKEKNTQEKTLIKLQISDSYAASMKYDSAIVYIKSSITDYEVEERFDDAGVMKTFLGRIYLAKGDRKTAEKYILEGKEMVKKIKNDNVKAILNDNVATFYSLQKDNKKAIELYNENIQYYLEGKKIDKVYILQAYRGLFTSAYVSKNYGQALKYVNSYVDFVNKNFPDQANVAYFQLGNIYTITKNYKKGIESYKKAISRKSNNGFDQFAKISLAMAYVDTKKVDSAKMYIKEPLEMAEKLNNNPILPMAYYVQAKIYREEGNLVKAEEILKKAISLTPEQDIESSRLSYNVILNSIQLSMIEKGITTFSTTEEKKSTLKNFIEKNEAFIKEIDETNVISDDLLKIEVYENLVKASELSENYNQAFSYLKKLGTQKENVYGVEKLSEFSNAQSEIELANARAKLKLEEETKRLHLQKEMELKALRYEYEKKQAAAKTEEERQRLILEEDLKRKEIELTYTQQKKALDEKYKQEQQIAKINQEKKDAVAKAELESSKNIRNLSILGTILASLLMGIAALSYFQKRKANKKIAQEKQKSDDLLLNILPYEVAEELKEKGKTSAKHYDEVSVLFTDFVNFTSTSEKIGVQEILNELNVCFTEFDAIMGKYGLEKIKTIGDAYLAVSGLPTNNPDHAKNAVNAALEITDFIEKRKQTSPNALDIRIGIHSGPVIAGIVGVKKFAYDIWGDTVNTAARMEQNSDVGKINISETTFDLVKEEVNCTHRGKIETKGKGAMEMYFVEGLINS